VSRSLAKALSAADASRRRLHRALSKNQNYYSIYSSLPVPMGLFVKAMVNISIS
jgi:hypothetical protein